MFDIVEVEKYWIKRITEYIKAIPRGSVMTNNLLQDESTDFLEAYKKYDFIKLFQDPIVKYMGNGIFNFSSYIETDRLYHVFFDIDQFDLKDIEEPEIKVGQRYKANADFYRFSKDNIIDVVIDGCSTNGDRVSIDINYIDLKTRKECCHKTIEEKRVILNSIKSDVITLINTSTELGVVKVQDSGVYCSGNCGGQIKDSGYFTKTFKFCSVCKKEVQ